MQTTTPKRNPASKSNRSDVVLNRLRRMRRPGESYGDVILGLVELRNLPSKRSPSRSAMKSWKSSSLPLCGVAVISRKWRVSCESSCPSR